jgi:ferric-dicitrate binding protein FerR (iron transport regulator)
MVEAHRLPDLDRIEREASEWIARLNADDVSTDDNTRFEEWCRAHARHVRTYDEMRATWRAFTAAGPLVRAVALGEAMNEAARQKTRRLHWFHTLCGRICHLRRRAM